MQKEKIFYHFKSYTIKKYQNSVDRKDHFDLIYY